MNYETKASTLTTLEAKEKFNTHGFLLVRGLFSTSLMEKIRSEAKSLSREDWSIQTSVRSTFLNSANYDNTEFFGITYAQPITSYLNTASELLGEELLEGANYLLETKDAFYKDAELHVRQSGSNHSIPAHQDNFYFGLETPSAVTCYVYLTEQSRHQGALGFFSKKLPNATLDHELGRVEGFSSFHPNMESKSNEFVYPSTLPGDVVFHHASTFHRAEPNKSQQSVASISIRLFSRSCLAKDRIIQKKYSENLLRNRG